MYRFIVDDCFIYTKLNIINSFNFFLVTTSILNIFYHQLILLIKERNSNVVDLFSFQTEYLNDLGKSNRKFMPHISLANIYYLYLMIGLVNKDIEGKLNL